MAQFAVGSCFILHTAAFSIAQQPFILGDAPRAPRDVSGLPGKGIRPLSVTGGFSVDINSREQVRSFYNAVYTSSDGAPMGTTSGRQQLFSRNQLHGFQRNRFAAHQLVSRDGRFAGGSHVRQR